MPIFFLSKRDIVVEGVSGRIFVVVHPQGTSAGCNRLHTAGAYIYTRMLVCIKLSILTTTLTNILQLGLGKMHVSMCICIESNILGS